MDGCKTLRPWQDSNLQSSDPKSDALSIGPQGRYVRDDNDHHNLKVSTSENDSDKKSVVSSSQIVNFGLQNALVDGIDTENGKESQC
ncbi:unnamed protein product [Thelazia callipaeda]|uniref:Ovule protein n=1 Tax=Thelazia callipaeda TaxID=103827 RepID=A0A0N5CW02_THECL|nr:unnamed protein product [Thelazia callipaeda]